VTGFPTTTAVVQSGDENEKYRVLPDMGVGGALL